MIDNIPPETYMNTYYTDDYTVVHDTIDDKLCRHWLWSIEKEYKDNACVSVHSIANFLIVQYELNLIDQIIYTHFNAVHEKRSEVSYSFLKWHNNPSCTMNPMQILKYIETKIFQKKFSKSQLLSRDDWTKNYLTLLSEVHWLPERSNIASAIMSDSDCANTSVIEYLSSRPK